MLITIKDKIENRCKRIAELSDRAEEKIKILPEGRIYAKHRNDRTYFYLYRGKGKANEKLLKEKDKDLISALLQKNYYENVIKAAAGELNTLRAIIDRYPEHVAEEIYDLLPEDKKKYVTPIIPTDEQLVSRWLAEPYVKKPISEDVPIFETKKGERVRSKSEMIIANMLYDNGIPYKYECPLFVGGEKIHPDFTILRLSDRKIIYYEHCGRMGDPGYVEDMVERSRKYTLAGICQGESLFYTFESAKFPLDVRVVSEMIEKNFR